MPKWHGCIRTLVVSESQYVSNSDTGTAGARLAALREIAARTRGAGQPLSPVVLAGFARASEFAVIALAGINCYYAYVAEREIAMETAYWTVSLATPAIAISAFHFSGLYALRALKSFVTQLPRLLIAWSGVAALLLVVAFFTKIGAEFSRVWMALWFASASVLLITVRASAAMTLAAWTRSGRLTRRGVIVGAGDGAAELMKALSQSRDNDVRICGIFDDREGERSPPSIAGKRRLGNIDELIEFARKAHIDLLIIALPITAETRVLDLLRRLWVLPVDIRLSAHLSRLRFRPRTYSYIGTVPFLDLLDRPLCDWNLVLKKAEDLVIGAAALALLAPVMALVALAVKLDSPGPVLFRQRRYGFNNELIEVLKFRSMYTDRCDRDAERLVFKGDPRVTRVGRFIRRTSLDELPQLINVIRGELSLVGPRPHALHAKAENRHYADVVDSYFARHRVKPGITGWAQVNGWRGETENEMQIRRRVEHDLYYINNWSLWLDLYILAMTPLALFGSERAY